MIPSSKTRALLDVARGGAGPTEAQRRALKERIEREVAAHRSTPAAEDGAVPSVFSALDRLAALGTVKRVLFAALAFAAAFGVDAVAPRELSILGVYLIPVTLVVWMFGTEVALLVEIGAASIACTIEIADAASYGSKTMLVVAVALRALFFVVVGLAAHDVKRAQRVLEERSERDPLTGLLNRRGFVRLAEVELERSRRHRRPMAIAFLDLDDFKRINDIFGHLAGDDLLRLAGKALSHGRRVDVVARVGGDEFVVLMPETTERGAKIAIERLRRRFAAAIEHEGISATFTTGLASFAHAPLRVETLLDEADKLLLDGKRSVKGSVHARRHEAEGRATSPADDSSGIRALRTMH
ncbi:MAG TPA: GGDEF domain-containing protein [Polyangiaceae bacterium]